MTYSIKKNKIQISKLNLITSTLDVYEDVNKISFDEDSFLEVMNVLGAQDMCYLDLDCCVTVVKHTQFGIRVWVDGCEGEQFYDIDFNWLSTELGSIYPEIKQDGRKLTVFNEDTKEEIPLTVFIDRMVDTQNFNEVIHYWLCQRTIEWVKDTEAVNIAS